MREHDPCREQRDLALFLIKACYADDDSRRLGLRLLRALEATQAEHGLGAGDVHVGPPPAALHRQDDLAWSYRKLMGMVSATRPLVLWLWRDDLRHRPLWLIRKRTFLLVAIGQSASPRVERPHLVMDNAAEAPEVEVGRIGDGSPALSRGPDWQDEFTVELGRLASIGLGYAWARAVMAGRCMYVGVPLAGADVFAGSSRAAQIRWPSPEQ